MIREMVVHIVRFAFRGPVARDIDRDGRRSHQGRSFRILLPIRKPQPAFNGFTDPVGPASYAAELKKIRNAVSEKLLDGLNESRRGRQVFDIETADLNAELMSPDYQVFVTLDLYIEAADIAFANPEYPFLLRPWDGGQVLEAPTLDE